MSFSFKFTHVIFLVLCAVYGAFSSMIPKEFELPELALFLLLLILVPVLGVIHGFFPTSKQSAFMVPNNLRVVVFLMLWIPILVGLFRQNELIDLIRDVLPFLFFLLPIFLFRKLHCNPKAWILVMCTGFSFIGVAMTLRHFAQAGASIADIGEQSIFGTGISLAFDPAIQFAFPFLFGLAIKMAIERHLLKASVLFFISLIPLFAILGVVARAPLVLSFFAIGLMVLLGFRNKVVNLIVFALFLLFIVVALAGDNMISRSIGLMLLKHENYGVSSRDLEVSAVLQNADSFDKIIFGEGWGGLISNPIGDGAMWRFVHNMFAYYFFKQGIVGLLGVIIYVAWLSKIYFRSFQKLKNEGGVRLIALLALIPPILGSLFLEVTYKTLIFGLLLSLVIAISASTKKLGAI
jgi:hypothetical protein